MPDEIIECVIAAKDPLECRMFPHLTNRDLKSLSQTGRFFRDFTFDERQQRAFNKLIRAAASGEQKDIDIVVAMVTANPSLLLERGDVLTRGGTKIINTTVYEFFLGSGHTDALEEISKQDLFAALLPNGEMERRRQHERYRPYIEQFRHDIHAYVTAYEEAGNSAYHSNYERLDYRPVYDLRPLIDLLIERATPADVTAELQQIQGYNSELRNEMCLFRETINELQRERTAGMHYAHYTTIMQVFHLLVEKSPESINGGRNLNFDMYRLVYSQIFGYLELVGLPASERFALARAFGDKELTAACKYQPGRRLQDFDFSSLLGTNLGFLFGVFGQQASADYGLEDDDTRTFINHMLSKSSKLSELMHTPQPAEPPRSGCVLL